MTTDLTWTSEKPTVTGCYWYQEHALDQPFVVYVLMREQSKRGRDVMLTFERTAHRLQDVTGRWAGPLEPPA